jgi:hypothetical protein
VACGDVVNLPADDIGTIEKNAGTLIDASKEVGLEINVEKTKYMLLSSHQNAGQNRDIKIADRSYENVSHSSNIWGQQYKSKFDLGGN